MSSETYDVIIVGGGPTGVALGIELGLHKVKTLILEKYQNPLLSPRAQFLNERTMELFMRWGIVEELKSKTLIPHNYPNQSVWCSKLDGVTYATASSQEQFSEELLAQQSIRIPLYITEKVLRERLNNFDSITFLKNEEVQSVVMENNQTTVNSYNRNNKTSQAFKAKYIIACDGANSITRKNFAIPFKNLAPKRRVINILFHSSDLHSKITVEKGFLYFLLENKFPTAIGIIDLEKGFWYSQIIYNGNAESIYEIPVNEMLEDITGISFNKEIINAHFWDMQVQIAEQFSKENKVFLVGDSAHAFAPTGGFGLNTGFGDVTNLAWKLAAVLQKGADESLLNTYEQERMPVALNNLNAAERNAKEIVELRKKFSPEKDIERFAIENARIAKQHVYSAGLTMGYCYFNSPLTCLKENQSQNPMPQNQYTPMAEPGYFLPHIKIDDKSIYEFLSPIHWSLIVSGDHDISLNNLEEMNIKILQLKGNSYPFRYILIRPDWHIALVGNEISTTLLENYFYSAHIKIYNTISKGL